jgi:hypothetical protein
LSSVQATTVAFGLLELARNPAFQEKLRAEIQDALGTSAVAYDGMPLLNAFIKVKWHEAQILNDNSSTTGNDQTLPSSANIRPDCSTRHDDPAD